MFVIIANKKDLQIVSTIDEGVPLSLIGDSSRLMQVLVNLVCIWSCCMIVMLSDAPRRTKCWGLYSFLHRSEMGLSLPHKAV